MEVTPFRMTPDVIRRVVEKDHPGLMFWAMLSTAVLPIHMSAVPTTACRRVF